MPKLIGFHLLALKKKIKVTFIQCFFQTVATSLTTENRRFYYFKPIKHS